MAQPAAGPADARVRIVASRKICSNLFLQQLLYYKAFYSVAWIVFWFVWICHTYWIGLKLKDDDTVRTVMMIFWLLAEPLRLVAGWYGNLQENLPWLVLFIILTVIPLHGQTYYMLFIGYDLGPWGKAVQVSQAILLEIELITGIVAARRMYKVQKQQFYLFEYAMNQRRRVKAGATVAPMPLTSTLNTIR